MSRFTRGGTERSAKKKGGVAGRSCVSGEKEMLCLFGAGKEMQCEWTYRFGCCSEDCYRLDFEIRKSLYLGQNRFFFDVLKRIPSVLMKTNNWVDFWGWQGTGSYCFEKRHCWVSHVVGKKGAISELGQYSFVFQIS